MVLAHSCTLIYFPIRPPPSSYTSCARVGSSLDRLSRSCSRLTSATTALRRAPYSSADSPPTVGVRGQTEDCSRQIMRIVSWKSLRAYCYCDLDGRDFPRKSLRGPGYRGAAMPLEISPTRQHDSPIRIPRRDFASGNKHIII